jgi:hypothetical protein
MKMSVNVTFVYQFDQQPEGFQDLHRIIDGLTQLGLGVSVETVGRDAGLPKEPDKLAIATPQQANARRRGRPPASGNGQDKPEVVPDKVVAPDVQDLNASPGGADESDPLDEELSQTEPSLTAQEARQKAMAIIQEIWNGNEKGSPARIAVKQVQSALNVAMFKDVPEDQGHAFYKLAVQLAEQVGHRA